MNINECGCRPYGWLGLDGNRCIRVIPRHLIYSFLTDNANVIHMSSLVLFIYPFMYNLVFRTLSAQMHIVHVICMLSHTCTHHLLVIFTTPHIPYYPQLSFSTYCLHKCTLSISCVYCLQMHMLCTSH